MIHRNEYEEEKRRADLSLDRERFELDKQIELAKLELEEKRYSDSQKLKNQLWTGTTAILPLVATLLTALVGYRQYLDDADGPVASRRLFFLRHHGPQMRR